MPASELEGRLCESLSRIRALNRALMTCDRDSSELDNKDIAHLRAMLDSEVQAALNDAEATHA